MIQQQLLQGGDWQFAEDLADGCPVSYGGAHEKLPQIRRQLAEPLGSRRGTHVCVRDAPSAAAHAQTASDRVMLANLVDKVRGSAPVWSEALLSLACPITLELPVNPVVASDGVVYDHDAIMRHIRQSAEPRSPVTNRPLNAIVFPATHVSSLLEALSSASAPISSLATWRAARESQITEARVREYSVTDDKKRSVYENNVLVRHEWYSGQVSHMDADGFVVHTSYAADHPFHGMRSYFDEWRCLLRREFCAPHALQGQTWHFRDRRLHRIEYASCHRLHGEIHLMGADQQLKCIRYQPDHRWHGEVHYRDADGVRVEFEDKHPNAGEIRFFAGSPKMQRLVRTEYCSTHPRADAVDHFEAGIHVRTTFNDGPHVGEVWHIDSGGRMVRKEHVDARAGEVHHYSGGCLTHIEFRAGHPHHGIVRHYRGDALTHVEQPDGTVNHYDDNLDVWRTDRPGKRPVFYGRAGRITKRPRALR